MLNDWFNSVDEIYADNYNFSQFKLKGKFHCDAEVERLQEITSLLVGLGRRWQIAHRGREHLLPLPKRSARQRQGTMGRLQCRVQGAILSIDVKWNQEGWKATLARLRQVHSFRCAEPR